MDTEKNVTIEETKEITEQVQSEAVTGEILDPETNPEVLADDEHSGTAIAAGVIIVTTITAAGMVANMLIKKHKAKAEATDEDANDEGVEYLRLTMAERVKAFFTGKVKVYTTNEEDEEG